MDLSVIILSYNTKEVTRQCLDALVGSFQKNSKLSFEVIIIDNASSDGSVKLLEEFKKKHSDKTIALNFIYNTKNVGYPKGNNQGLRKAKGKYVLLLNSDAIITRVDWQDLLDYTASKPEIGATTIKVVLPSGTIDPASHRGFPTIWNAFCYFSGFEKVFGKAPLIGKYFGGYHLTHLNLATIHEIDSPTGAFFLSPKKVLDKVGGFDDKNFFLYGEDLDLAFRIKKLGYKVIYYPLYEVLHLKRTSGLKKRDEKIRSKSKEYFYDSMKIFYKKHYAKTHSKLTNNLVYFTIGLKKRFS